VLFFCFWNVYPTQSRDDIPPWVFCHNSFGGTSSLDIQNDQVDWDLAWSPPTLLPLLESCHWAPWIMYNNVSQPKVLLEL
jgi:hypothetical protein